MFYFLSYHIPAKKPSTYLVNVITNFRFPALAKATCEGFSRRESKIFNAFNSPAGSRQIFINFLSIFYSLCYNIDRRCIF